MKNLLDTPKSAIQDVGEGVARYNAVQWLHACSSERIKIEVYNASSSVIVNVMFFKWNYAYSQLQILL